MARQDALLRLHKTLVTRRAELRKRLGMDLEDLAHVKHSSASGDAADWPRLALELGYFDQAHFIKDFKTIVGRTPGEYARHLSQRS